MKAGWEIKKLGEVCQFINGRAYKKAELLDNGKYPVLRVGNFFTQDKWYFSDLELPENKYCDNGDLLYAWSASFGPRIWQGEKVIYHYHIWKIIENANLITKEFLYFLLDWDTDNLKEKYGTGTTMTHVGKGSIESREVPLPPLPEQRRIVAILDEAFAGIAAAKENAEQNLKNAKEVFTSYLKSIFADAWLNSKIVKLEDLATDITDGDHMPPPKTKEGVPFITIGNIIKNTTSFTFETKEIDFSETFMVSNEYFNSLKHSKRPVAGDILYTVTGSFGIPVLIRESKKFCFQRHIGLIRPKEKVYSEWLYYLLMSPQVVKQANEGATGTAQRTVSLSVLRNFQVPSLSLSKQKDIAIKVSDIGKETSRLESLYQQKLSNLEELKKSLLQQAFSGAL
jgi:restriction endonuclease S subunit